MHVEKRRKTYVAVVKTVYGNRTISLHTEDLQQAKRRARMAKLETMEAKRISNEAMAVFASGKHTTVRASIREWTNRMRHRGLSHRTIGNNLSYVRMFLKLSKVKDKDAPGSITEAHVDRFINRADEAKASTRNIRLSVIRHYCRFCCAKGWMKFNPADVVEKVNKSRLSFAQKEPSRKVPFTDEEIARLLAYVDEQIVTLEAERAKLSIQTSYRAKEFTERIEWYRFWRVAIPVSRWAGLRIGDVCGLQWESFTSKPGVIVVHCHKTGVRLELPMCEPLRAALDLIPRGQNQSAYCFVKQRDMADTVQRTQIQKKFKMLTEAVGITGKTFHCFRTTCARDLKDRLVAAGRTEQQATEMVRDYLGHSSVATTTSHYL